MHRLLLFDIYSSLFLRLSPQEQEDLALAQALAASEEEYRRQQQQQRQQQVSAGSQ